ncbi:MAG: hypothetical protein Tsb0013_19060 [Phycisphaerales bacterium]
MTRLLRLTPLLLVPLLCGCAATLREPSGAGGATDSPALVTYTTDELVTIRGVVTIPETSTAEHAKVSIRYANGAMAVRLTPDRRGVYQTTRLFPDERYTVSAEFAMGPGGPWHFPSVEVDGTPGSVHRVDFAPFDGDAGLTLAVDEGTQPYMFALYPAGTPTPTVRKDLQRWFEEGKGYRTPVYLRMGEGGGPWREDRLEPGRYLAVAMANDWVPGDPVGNPVCREIELRSGVTTSLHLGARCTTLVER